MLEGDDLDQHGYLIDLIDVESEIDTLIARYRDKTLNDLPPLEGMNPSIERFCRLLCEELNEALYAPNITAISVKLWENTIAWAAFDLDR